MKKYINVSFQFAKYDNDVDALIPERWAMEGLSLLEEEMVASNLVARNFENEIQEEGDVVNVHAISRFDIKRKGTNDPIVIQNAVARPIPVPLDQHLYVSFMIRDAEQSKSFAELTTKFLVPAMSTIASGIDKIVAGTSPWFLKNSIGRLQGLTPANAVSTLVRSRQRMNDLKLNQQGRYMLIDTQTEATLLETNQFIDAEKVGDDGTAMREASLGRKFGQSIFMDQNVPYVNKDTADRQLGLVDEVDGYFPGDDTITVNDFTQEIINGSYVTFEESGYPYRVVSSVGGATPTQIVIEPALQDRITDDTHVAVSQPVLIDNASGYPQGYEKEFHVDGYAASPQVGQPVTDTNGNIYTITAISNDTGTECDLLLNVPLKKGVSDDEPLFLFPAGSYNLGFAADAVALVNRPLALPNVNNVQAAVATYNDISLRVVFSYDAINQGVLVTVDTLCGIALLDVDRGLTVLG